MENWNFLLMCGKSRSTMVRVRVYVYRRLATEIFLYVFRALISCMFTFFFLFSQQKFLRKLPGGIFGEQAEERLFEIIRLDDPEEQRQQIRR